MFILFFVFLLSSISPSSHLPFLSSFFQPLTPTFHSLLPPFSSVQNPSPLPCPPPFIQQEHQTIPFPSQSFLPSYTDHHNFQETLSSLTQKNENTSLPVSSSTSSLLTKIVCVAGGGLFLLYRYPHPFIRMSRSFYQVGFSLLTRYRNTSASCLNRLSHTLPSSLVSFKQKLSKIPPFHSAPSKALVSLETFISRKTGVLIGICSSFFSIFRSFIASPPSFQTHTPPSPSSSSLDHTFFHGTQSLDKILHSGVIRPHVGWGAGKGVYLSSDLGEASYYAQWVNPDQPGAVLALNVFPSRQFHIPNHPFLNYFIHSDNILLTPSLRAIFLYPSSLHLQDLITRLHPQVPLYIIENQYKYHPFRISSMPLNLFDLNFSPLSFPPPLFTPTYPYQHLYFPIQDFSHISSELIIPPSTPLFSCRLQAAEEIEELPPHIARDMIWNEQIDSSQFSDLKSGLSLLKVPKTDCQFRPPVALTNKELSFHTTCESLLFLHPKQQDRLLPQLPPLLQKKDIQQLTTFKGPHSLYDIFNPFCLFFCLSDPPDSPPSSDLFIFEYPSTLSPSFYHSSPLLHSS